MSNARAPYTLLTFAGAALVAACTSGKNAGTADTTAMMAGATAAGAAAMSHDTATGAMHGDADVAAVGATGLPAGYWGRADNAAGKLTDAKYAARGNAWEVTTGPAHIVYAAKDSASGAYTASASFQQLEAPRHPEAFGMFVGGRNLDQPSQQYTYFVVRGEGDVLVRVRDGAKTRDVIAWRASPAVPKADAAGKGSYALAVKVAADSVRFMVNGKEVAAVAKAAVPTDGVAGLRVNHNLHVQVQPVTITRS